MEKASSSETRLRNFPVSFFSVVMGLAGFTIATQKTEELTRTSPYVSTAMLVVTSCVFAVLAFLYALKMLLHPSKVKEEFGHSVRLSFFPTVSISLLLISIGLLKVSPSASRLIWVVGAAIHLGLTVAILSIWMHHTKFEIHHMSPAWFIPVVGNILVPIAGVSHASEEVSWFFFSIGLVFWMVLFAIVINRIIFHHPLAERMLPTLFIMIAPPSVGFISYVRLTDAVDPFARVLYYFALFLTLLLLFQIKVFLRIRFFISWWAFSFPVAAITIASVLMYHRLHNTIFMTISYALYGALIAIVLMLVARTIAGVLRRDICTEEH